MLKTCSPSGRLIWRARDLGADLQLAREDRDRREAAAETERKRREDAAEAERKRREDRDREDRNAEKERDRQFTEKTGDAAERLHHAIRKDLGLTNRIFIPGKENK